MSSMEVIEQTNKRYGKVPWLFSLGTATFWGLLFWVFGRLHGMWNMYEGMFPLLIASLFGVTKTNLSVMQALLFAALDGAIAGWLLGRLLQFFLRRML